MIEAHAGLHRLHASGSVRFSPTPAAFKLELEGDAQDHRGGRELSAPRSTVRRCSCRPRSRCASKECSSSDIAMSFDECTAYPASEAEARASMELVDALGGARVSGAITRRRLRGRSSASCKEECTRACARHRWRRSRTSGSRSSRSAASPSAKASGAPSGCWRRWFPGCPPQAPLSHGRRAARGHPGGRASRHRHVRLRHAHAPRAQRPPFHPYGGDQHP